MVLNQQLHFISGKGGVGKSVFACALGCHFSQQGFRTLLVQINAEDSHSHYLGSPPIHSEFQTVRPFLEAINLTPEESLKEYILLKIKSRRLYALLFENQVMRSFFKFMPSLPELNMLGKIWFHANERLPGVGQRYERIVVDCPATGHGLKFLQVGHVTHKGVQKGPIAEEAAAIEAMIGDVGRTLLHVVTLAEDLPVQETCNLVKNIKEKQLMGLGFLVINAWFKTLFDKNLQEKVHQTDGKLPWKRVAQRRIAKEVEQEEHRNTLKRRCKEMPFLFLPYRGEGDMGPEDIDVFSKQVVYP